MPYVPGVLYVLNNIIGVEVWVQLCGCLCECLGSRPGGVASPSRE